MASLFWSKLECIFVAATVNVRIILIHQKTAPFSGVADVVDLSAIHARMQRSQKNNAEFSGNAPFAVSAEMPGYSFKMEIDMKKDFFVMLNTQNGGITPLVDDETEKLATYDSVDEAKDAAKSSMLGDMCGFEVFQRGYGVA